MPEAKIATRIYYTHREAGKLIGKCNRNTKTLYATARFPVGKAFKFGGDNIDGVSASIASVKRFRPDLLK